VAEHVIDNEILETRMRTVTSIVYVLIGTLLLSASSVRGESLVPLEIPEAKATDAGSMQPYTEQIEHTEVTIKLVPIPGGTYTMGSPESESGRKADEGPVHEVKIDPFWMGAYEITWDQYDIWFEKSDIQLRDILGEDHTPRDPIADAVTRPTEPYTDMSFGRGRGKKPAISMTQHAARKYCEWLTVKTGRYYRLPTEAEWEYACRAGSKTAYSFGDGPAQLGEYAWFKENSEKTYHDVGTKKPNAWGLYDMHGNVTEWVLDQHVADFYAKGEGKLVTNPLAIPTKLYPRVVRGGGWNDEPMKLRSSVRDASHEDWKVQDPQSPKSIWYHTDAQWLGFRIVRPLVEPTAQEKVAKWDKTAPPQLDPPEGEESE